MARSWARVAATSISSTRWPRHPRRPRTAAHPAQGPGRGRLDHARPRDARSGRTVTRVPLTPVRHLSRGPAVLVDEAAEAVTTFDVAGRNGVELDRIARVIGR